MDIAYDESPKTNVPIERAIVGQEMRGMVMHTPRGPVQGYQWRLQVRVFATPGTPEETIWTPWVFGSVQSVEDMLRHWDHFLRTEGHLAAGTPPGTTRQ